MELHDLADVATVVGGIALFVSVVLLIHELRENNRLAKAANTQALVGLSSPFNLALIQDPKMAEFYVLGGQQFAEMNEVDRYRYRSLLMWWLIFHENVYHQWRQGLLTLHSFQPWLNELKQFVKLQQLWLQWDGLKDLFERSFARHVTRVIHECRPAEVLRQEHERETMKH
jgi:hypothetical protein